MGQFAPADKLQIKLRSLTEAQTVLAGTAGLTVETLLEAARKIEAYYLEADPNPAGRLPPVKN